jgi:antitoxin MazE
MTTITTKLIKDGNSVAVRLPKTALIMSGLRDEIQMEIKQGQITLRSPQKNRAGWENKIESIIKNNPRALQTDSELDDWDVTLNDGF